MKILILFIVVTFAYLNCLNAQPETNSLPRYSINDVRETNVRVIKKAVMGMTVEHFTSYISENEYTIKINVRKNKIINIPDSTLILECFFSEKSVTKIIVNLDNVEWTSEDNFSYSFPIVVEKSGWVYFCISTPSEISQESHENRYRQLTLNAVNRVLYLNSLEK
ncbi:MAG: hypothetical protein ACYCVH_16865 [Ignavibacteriaceae bacterium]